MKIVINRCFGGFSLTEPVYKELGIEHGGYGFLRNEDLGIESDNRDAVRADPRLVAAVEKIGLKESSGRCAKLGIVEIPDGVDWEIDEYDGYEHIAEKHRTW